ncbi:PLP-dependent aminotransferase family protein [Streptomyces hoynatensis]|uniref:PLP-dependent aminotransferase family protein n=1 Tax=Streptomyces hoynatensis TaxID=1141874 RepID=A0A3A9YUY7_9ACTN|nr:PLP-dependent aminotransferase family protein [Streptomyces hoynatensis]
MRGLRDAIRSGRLAPGTRLPSSRSLAADLGIARNTVAGAYAELAAEGWLVARQGSGTRVAPRAASGPAAEASPPPRPEAAPRPVHDLLPGRPDVAAFPRAAWLSSARRALGAAPREALGVGDPRGRPELRLALADYLARARGVFAEPGRIVVCSGFHHGLGLLARVPRIRRRTLAVESYGLFAQHRLLAAEGVRTTALPVDERGAVVGELAGRQAGAVLLTPAHQFPTGAWLHPERRAAVVDWARESGGLVIEDDYDGEYRYDREPLGALQSLDPERVGYLGSVSKSLGPGVRLGWLVLPAGLVEEVLAVKGPWELTTGSLDQLTLADFLESGGYDRHVRRMRQRYRRRRDQLVAALAARLPGLRVTGISAGLHAVVELPAGAERRVLREARRRGVGLSGLAAYRHQASPGEREGPAHESRERRGEREGGGGGEGPEGIPEVIPEGIPEGIVVGYGAPPEHGFAAALDALCLVLEAALSPRCAAPRRSRGPSATRDR